MKMSRNLLVIALLIAAPLTSMAEEAARKRARHPFVPIDLARIIQEFGEFLPLLEYLSCCKESNLSTPERGEDDYTA